MIVMKRLAVLLVLVAMLAACGASSTRGSHGRASDRIKVSASFYPLQYVAQRIGGDQVVVTSLTKPGAEPHDLELTPRDVAALQDADLVVYLHGFQPAVDDAVGTAHAAATFDAAPSARLDRTYTPIEDGEQHAAEAGATDPHFWLDPSRLRDVAVALERRLAEVAPADAATFATNLAALERDLTTLDDDFRAGLRHCADRNLVTSHNAFGYLAHRYGLTQVGITGLTPEAEPGAQQLADVARFVSSHHVRTIYYETLVSPALAQTVARETGAASAVLDPLEGIVSTSQGADYLQVMRANLASLRHGQGCR
jgi:zinc transport system substrate-binding protein